MKTSFSLIALLFLLFSFCEHSFANAKKQQHHSTHIVFDKIRKGAGTGTTRSEMLSPIVGSVSPDGNSLQLAVLHKTGMMYITVSGGNGQMISEMVDTSESSVILDISDLDMGQYIIIIEMENNTTYRGFFEL